jgi:hypothetical protein
LVDEGFWNKREKNQKENKSRGNKNVAIRQWIGSAIGSHQKSSPPPRAV